MKKNCFGKILVIGLMILFIGASVFPGIGGKINQLETKNEPQTSSCMGVYWEDDFDSYAAGSALHGQGGWEAWDNNPTTTAYVTNNQSHSPDNSAEIDWFKGVSCDIVYQFSGVSSGAWNLTVWQYVPSDMQGNSYYLLLDDYSHGGPYAWSLQLEVSASKGRISDFDDPDTWLTLVTDDWAEIRVEIDFEANNQKVYYNGSELLQKSWGASKNLACIDLYADTAPSTSVYYDDFSLEGGPGEGPDLECEGELRWEDVGPGSALEGSFKVRNIGGSGSELDWNITHEPSWGEWIFTPSSGDDLTPEEGNFTVEVDAIAPPDPDTEFNGKVRVENREDPDDFCEIPVYIRTPRSKTLPNTLFMRVLEKFLNAFPILQRLLNL
jgi:hypothetical protein